MMTLRGCRQRRWYAHQPVVTNDRVHATARSSNTLKEKATTPAPTAPPAYHISMTYDADGERATRTAAGATTVYLGGAEEQTGSALKRYYSFNGQIVAMRTSAGVTYLHGDHLGSVSASSDSAGSSIARQYFDPWGQIKSGAISATTLSYTGQRLDGTGLLYYHARMYDPVLARFVSADSVVPGASDMTMGPSKQSNGPADPQQLNRFSYVSNNPVNTADPTGHCPMCIGAVIGAAVGAGIAYGAQVAGNMQSGMDFQQALTTNINGAAIVTGAVAGLVVGGSLGIASTPAIAGYTVGSAVQLGAVSAVSNMAGNVMGQAFTTGSVNPTDVAVAGVTGFAAGTAAPIVASTAIGSMLGGYVGSIALGTAANTSQYAATQSIKGDSLTTLGMATNALSGAVGGGFGGPTSKLQGLSFLKPSLKANELLNANITRSGIARGFFGGTASNINYEPALGAQ